MTRILNKLSKLAFILLMCACNESKMQIPVIGNNDENEKIAVAVSCVMSDILTRAEVNEALVEDVNLYVVNEAGDLITHQFYEDTSDMTAEVYRDREYTLYIIANAGKVIKAKDEDELTDLVCQIASIDEMANSRGGVLMAGKSVPKVLSHGEHIEIGLERCISKIVLKCDFEELYDDVQLDIKRVSLKNVPNKIHPFKENRIEDPSFSIDGGYIVAPSVQMLKDGVVFYQYENMQGTLQPENSDQKLKVWPEGDVNREICSFIEIEAIYSSSRKRGNILYRFYLGRDMVSNYDVIRNTQHTIMVSFKGDGSVEETTWRVDNSAIEDLVTSITISPQEYIFDKWGETIQLSAMVLPVTANDRRVSWRSSNESVATVDQNGAVTSVGDGYTLVTATSCDGSGVTAHCAIEVDAKIPVTSIDIPESELQMYKNMNHKFTAAVYPSDATDKSVIWKSSDENMVKINANGLATGGWKLGSCYIYAISADNNQIKDSCMIILRSVELVSITGDRDIYIKVGEKYQLTWWSDPPDALVTFRSCNTPCVTVDENGIVTGIAPTATIVDIFAFGSRDFYYVTVEE